MPPSFQGLTLASTGYFQERHPKTDNILFILRLDLPEYKSYEELRSKLVTAIEESSGFDGVD